MDGWIAGAAFGTAVVVAWLGFRYAIRQDERRWTRERRAELYVDLLVNESAEHDWLLHRVAEIEAREALPSSGPHDRISSVERRRLGARATAFASREVVRRWNALQAEEAQALLLRKPQPLVNVHLGAGMDALAAQIRHELETERLPGGDV